MARPPRIGDWPFAPDEEVLLLWLRSPHRSPRGRQWRLGVCFRPVNGSPCELEMPWGALPQLALGLTYLDGYAVEEQTAWGSRIEFEVPPGLRPVTRPACEVLPPDVLAGMVGEGGKEHCIVFDLPNQRIVLPVLEAIRTLLCPNRTLASGLLEPEYLSRIVAKHEIVNGTLQLEFAWEIAPAALDQAVARRVGRLLYDDSFRRAWDAVERERYRSLNQAGPSHRIPLLCPLPELQPRWVVRAMPMDVAGTWLVLEILAVSAVAVLPYRRVSFTHPEITRTLRDDTPAASGENDGGGEPAGAPRRSSDAGTRPGRSLSIDRSDHAPHNSRRARRVGTVISGLLGEEWVEVVRQATRTRIRREPEKNRSEALMATDPFPSEGVEAVIGQPDSTEAAARSAGAAEVGELEAVISLASAARDGRHPAGEYQAAEPSPDIPAKPVELRPLPLVCKPHEGLNRLAATLNHLATQRPDWTIEWALAPLAGSIPYVNMGTQKRQYALVRCAGGADAQQPACWLLEFARLDQHTPSTLLFFPGADDGADDTPVDEEVRRRVSRLVRGVLAAALREKGWWNQSELMKFHHAGRMRFLLVSHHFSYTPENWAERLEKHILQARQAAAR